MLIHPKAAAVAALLLTMSTPAFAQDYTLNGTPVPADQVDRLQAHCESLEAREQGSIADSSTETAPIENPDSSQQSGETDNAAGGAMSGAEAGEPVDFATLDLLTVDLAACEAGGFEAADGN